jgi:hypothetical protein
VKRVNLRSDGSAERSGPGWIRAKGRRRSSLIRATTGVGRVHMFIALLSVFTTGLVVGVAAPSQAVTGGDVIRHDSIQNLVIAKDIRNYNAGYGGNCTIWNWNGGSGYSWVSGANAISNCRTASMNGRTYSWTLWNDTDAFTMQYESYWVSMHGTWRHLGANVYTKITDIENAHCYREVDGVNCYVTYG